MKAAAGILCCTLLLAGCASTPAARIARDRAAFAAWPPQVQSLVQAGQIAIGFTAAQVRMALGRPDRVDLRTTAEGTNEIWTYERRGPQFSFGIGVLGGGGSTRVGGATAATTGGPYPRDHVRVIFDAGKVSAVEQAAQ